MVCINKKGPARLIGRSSYSGYRVCSFFYMTISDRTNQLGAVQQQVVWRDVMNAFISVCCFLLRQSYTRFLLIQRFGAFFYSKAA